MALFAYLSPKASMFAFDMAVYAHLLVGGIAVGFLSLAQARLQRAGPRLMAAAMFMMGGSAAARLQHTGMIFSYAFMPLALLALEESFARRSYRLAIRPPASRPGLRRSGAIRSPISAASS